MRLCDLLAVDHETASQTYLLCLLFYVGCTAPVDGTSDIFGDDNALTTYGLPNRFESRIDGIGGFLRALAPPMDLLARARQVALRGRAWPEPFLPSSRRFAR